MRKIKFINNGWLYKDSFDVKYLDGNCKFEDFKAIDLPHTNKELPYNCFNENEYQFVSTYSKSLFIDSSFKEKKTYVDFEGVMIAADVYFNGKHLINHKGGYAPFSVDITDYIRYGEDNILIVVVDSTERKDIPPYGNVVDYLTYGGIYREVSIRSVPKTFIKNIYCSCYNPLKQNKDLEVKVAINNYIHENINVNVDLLSEEKVIASIEKNITLNDDINENVLIIENIKDVVLWDIGNPKLYKIKVTLKYNNEIIDEYSDNFGFRDAIFKEDGFYLNGRKLKLIGLNRHQSYPYVGYAMPERVQKKDADILKFDLGVNIVRTSHYMQSRHFLNRCDEIGLLVFEEIPGWQHIGDKLWQDISACDTESMIKRDYNRPSIIMWGVRINESGDNHDFYYRTNKIAKSLDKIRQTGGVRYLYNSELLEDVYTINDFTHNGGDKVFVTREEATCLNKKVPYLVTESNGHMYPTKRFDQEVKLVEHANRHLRVINEALGSKEISGSISWCAFDYNTHSAFGSGDKICYHGVMDMFRNSKYAAYAYSSQRDVKDGVVLEPITLGCRGEKDGGGILPFTILTNCDYIKIFKSEKCIDSYYPDKVNFINLNHPPIVINHLGENDGWGEVENMLTVKGFVNNKEVISKNIGELKWRDKIEVIPDDLELSINMSSYDATRIVVKLLDNLGNVLQFSNEFIEVEIDGPAKILGPNKFGIMGGITAFWIRTIGEVGTVKIKVNGMYYNEEVVIDIK